jgi:transcriptional regulator with XRE-family HTH domain
MNSKHLIHYTDASKRRGLFMKINQQTLKQAIAKRKINSNYESKPIGSAIRFRRKSLNMTLEEGAEGICSVSYLSKIENNQIEVSDRFADQLIERFEIKVDQDPTILLYEDHLNQLTQAMLHQHVLDESILVHYQGRQDHQSILVDLVFHHLIKQYQRRTETFAKMKQLIPLLNHQELGLLLITIADYHFQLEKYEVCYDVIMMMPDDQYLCFDLQILKKKYFLKSAIKLHRLIDVLEYMEAFYRYLFEHHLYAIIKELRMDYLWLLSFYRHPSHMEYLLSKFDINKNDSKNWILANAYFHQEDYHKALSIIEKEKDLSDAHTALYLLILEKIYPVSSNHSSDITTCDNDYLTSSQYIKRHFYYKYHQDPKETITYLRRDLMGLRTLPEYPFLTEYLLIDAEKLFSSQHYYKESAKTMRRLIHHINQLKTAPRREIMKEST